MIYICVICTGQKLPLSSLADEHRRILEAIVSPTLNLAQLKSFPMWICESCQSLINTVETFKNIALVGASHLLTRLASVQEEQDEHLRLEHPPLLPVKQDPDDLLGVKSYVEFEIEQEHVETVTEINIGIKDDPDGDLSATASRELDAQDGTTVEKISDQSTTRYGCHACRYETRDTDEIARHRCDKMNIENSEDAKSQKGKSEANSKNPASRVKRRTKKPPGAFKCRECYVRFADEAALAKHCERRHKATEDLYVCDLCKKEFKSKYRLKIHLALHRKKESQSLDTMQQLFCVECGLQCESRHRYNEHVMYSLKHNPRDKWRFKCDSCEKLFLKKYDLKLHMNSVHLNKPDHQCAQCHKVFRRRHLLQSHVDVVHEGKAKPRPHVCRVCAAAFTEKRTLTDHLSTHSNVRPHACPLCPATFNFKAALYNHNRLKHLKIKGNWKKKPKKGKEKKEPKAVEKS